MASSRQRLINASSFLSNQKEQIGGLNVKKSSISGGAFKRGTSLEKRVGVNEKKITLLKNIGSLRKDNQKKQFNSPLLESLQSIASTVGSIRDTLIQQQDNDKGIAEDMRREKEEKERKDQEKGLEAPKPLQKIADKVIAPVMSVWGRIWKFISTIFLGKILMNFLDWFGNPENQGKITTLVRFVKDWWPAIVGSILLFGTGFGGLVTGLTVAIATWIPKMLASIAALKASKLGALGGKAGLLKGGLLVGGGILAGMGISKMMNNGDDVSNEKIQEFNKGGKVGGSGNKDTVPAMLTPGEFVMSKGAVEQYGVDTMESMNAAAGGTNVPVLMTKKKRRGYNDGAMVVPEGASAYTGKDKEEQEAYMLKFVNEERAFQGLPPLKKITYAEGVFLEKARGPGPRTSENTQTTVNFDTMMKTVTKTINGETTSKTYKMGNDEIKAEASERGYQTMEMKDGSIGIDAGKFASKKVSEYLANTRERLKDNPKALEAFNAREDVASVTQGLADGSTETMVNDAYQKALGFQGGGLVTVKPGTINSYQDAIDAGIKVEDIRTGSSRFGSIRWLEKHPKGWFGKQKYTRQGTQWNLSSVGGGANKELAMSTEDYVNMKMGWSGASSAKGQSKAPPKLDRITGDPGERTPPKLNRGSSGILGPISSNVDAMVNTDKYEVKPKEKKNVVIDYNQEATQEKAQQDPPPAGGNDIPAFDVRPPFMTDQDKMMVLGMRV